MRDKEQRPWTNLKVDKNRHTGAEAKGWIETEYFTNDMGKIGLNKGMPGNQK